MKSFLEDQLTFTFIENDSMVVNEDRLIRTLLQLRRKTKVGCICNDEYNMAILFGASAACLKGLSQLHKTNQPLRSVMPATKAVNYDLGKRATNDSSLLRNSTHIIKDSFDFVRKIQESIQTDKIMLSFDVTNVYTNVPLTFTIDYILNQKYPACSSSCQQRPGTKQ
jgi:hypothetical protein